MSWDTETADKCKLPELDPKLCDDCRCYAYCYRQMKMEEQMSVSKWAYIPERCDGDACPGDCDCCSKAKDNVALMEGEDGDGDG